MGIHTLLIPGFHPARLNQYEGRHWSAKHRLKRGDRQLVAFYAREQAVPRAAGRRRVSVTYVLARGQRAFDPDACWKSLLDALVAARLLLDDRPSCVELGGVAYERGERSTRVVLEDID